MDKNANLLEIGNVVLELLQVHVSDFQQTAQNLDLSSIFTKISIFNQNFDFLIKISKWNQLMTKISSFGKKSIFWPKLRFFDPFHFWPKNTYIYIIEWLAITDCPTVGYG